MLLGKERSNKTKSESSTNKILSLIVLLALPLTVYAFVIIEFFHAREIKLWVVLSILLLDLILVIIMIRFAVTTRHISVPFFFYILSSALMIGVFAHIYEVQQSLNFAGQTSFDYFDSFYFSVITWTSLGYGDVAPDGSARSWIIVEVAYGYIHMGLFMGFILNFLTRTRASNE